MDLCDACGRESSDPDNLYVYCDGICHILPQTRSSFFRRCAASCGFAFPLP
jgi:hypothetical protein